MAGLPVETDPITGQTDVLDTNYVTRSQGTTAQNMSPVYLQDNSASVGNSSSVLAPGNANPADARPGYLAAGQPGGNNADTLVPGGQYSTDNQVQLIGSPAGTAGGGSYYPNQSGADAVPNPMVFTGWTAQAKADEDTSALYVKVNPEYTAAHDTSVADLFTPTITGGDSTYTVTTVEVDGVTTATLPTGFTLTSSTGQIALSTSTSAGTYTLGFRVADGSTPVNYTTYEVTVVLS